MLKMNKKLEQVRTNLIKSSRELDRISKCPEARIRLISITVKAVLKGYYKY